MFNFRRKEAPFRRLADQRSRIHRNRSKLGRLLVGGATLAITVGTALTAAPTAQAVTAANADPVAKISLSIPKAPLTVGTELTLDGSGSYDPEGQPLTYHWSIEPNDDDIDCEQPSDYRGKIVTHRFTVRCTYRITLTVEDTAGARGSTSVDVEVTGENSRPLPDIRVSPSNYNPAIGEVVTFSASRTEDDQPLSELTFDWYFRESWYDEYVYLGSGMIFEHQFDSEGPKYFNLVVTDPYGSSNERGTMVTIEGVMPAASFTRSPSSPTIQSETKVSFDAGSSTGNGLRYSWQVDGATPPTSADGATFEHIFTDPGSHKVELTITDEWRRTAVTSTEITVAAAPSGPPVARFNQTPSSPTVDPDTKVTFDGSASTGDGLTYAWYVRGESGVVSTNKVLNHTFKTAGDYGIELRVTDTAGTVSRKWTGLTVTAQSEQPVATFVQTPAAATADAGTKVIFDGSASTGDGLTYAWYVRGESGVVSTNKVLNHTFKTAGDYGIELRVTDTAGRTAKKWTGLKVTGTNNPPTANFTQTPNSAAINTGTAVTFDGSTSSDPDGDQLKYYWFIRGEKGVVSTDKVLNHTFKTAGDYGVELRVVDPTGATARKWIGLTVAD